MSPPSTRVSPEGEESAYSRDYYPGSIPRVSDFEVVDSCHKGIEGNQNSHTLIASRQTETKQKV